VLTDLGLITGEKHGRKQIGHSEELLGRFYVEAVR
jgi:hypothetical protein